MAIGERIHFFRTLRGMTMKFLGQSVGFPEKSADVRLAQYENGARSPKTDLTEQLADVLGVAPQALAVPDIDTHIGLMHTFFALEDLYGIKIGEIDGEMCFRMDKFHKEYKYLFDDLYAWKQQLDLLNAGQITKDQYDEWRYNYPKHDTYQNRISVPDLDK